MNNKSKRPYSTPSRTIKSKGIKKNNATARVMKTAAASKNRKNSIPSRTEKSFKMETEKKQKKPAKVIKEKTSKTKKVDLEQTTRIRIDQERINDFETLDTSFLEGRIDKKIKNNKIKKEKLLKEKKPSNINFEILKKIFFGILTICVIVLAIVFSFSFMSNVVESYNEQKDKKEEVNDKSKEESKAKTTVTNNGDIVDDNYLFVGDIHTDRFNFDDYDYHYVKVSEREFTTKKILDEIKDRIYKYNPSIVFVQLGIIDLDEKKSTDEIINNLRDIVKKIKENRPYTKIYIESLYPINKDVEDYKDDIISKDIDNERIIEVNKRIKELTKKQKVNYLDLFSVLSEDGKLKKEYTDNGVELNDKAYDKLKEEIRKIVG